MAKSLKVNTILNMINTVTMLLYPLITFPYVSRIMLADGIGQVNFYTSIVAYISLFTELGIPLYGVREIARVKDNPLKLKKTVLEILSLHFILTILGYIVVAILALSVDRIQENIPMFLILSSNILFLTIGVEWFYKGIEDFGYITLRGVLVRILGLFLYFALIHSKADILVYAGLTIIGTVGGNIFNFVRLQKILTNEMVSIKSLDICRHIKPASKIFLLTVTTSIYCNLDTVLLGFLKGNTSVGYYTGATRISNAILALVTAIGPVMIPRLSYIIQNKNWDEFHRLSQKTLDLDYMFSLPILGGVLIVAPTIIQLLCGPSYVPAINTLLIISPVIFIISVSNVLGIQILYPLGLEKIVIISTSVGAISNLVLNLLLIPYFSQNGAAFATIVAESLVTGTMIYLGRKYVKIHFINRHLFICIFSSIVMMIFCHFVYICLEASVIRIIITPLVGAIVYSLCMLLMRDKEILSLIGVFVKRQKK